MSGVSQVRFLCAALDEHEKLLQPPYLVYPRQPDTPCHSITLQNQDPAGASFMLTLSTLPPEVRAIICVASIGEHTHCLRENAGDISNGMLALFENEQEVARYAFSAQDFGGEKALVLGRFYYHKDSWRLAIAGDGFRAGIGALLHHYGVPETLIQETPPSPPPPDLLRAESAPPPTRQAPDRTTPPACHPVILPTEWPGNTPPPLPHGLVHSVGILLVEQRDGSVASGSCFAVNPGGYLLSCYHVIEDASKVNVCMGESTCLRPVNFVAGSKEHDVALLWIADGSGLPSWMVLVPPTDEPRLGEELGLLAYPLSFNLGMGVNYSQGIINSCRQRDNGSTLLQIDAGAAPGSSGGPVFRRSDGRVIGILQSGIERHGMLINLAWDIRTFWKLGWHLA